MATNDDLGRIEQQRAREMTSHARRRPTSADRLLHYAIEILGVAPLAAALQLRDDDVRSLAHRDEPMTLPQQRVLAMAVLAATTHKELRRKAAALLAQVRAAEDYHSGVTVRHSTAPSVGRWK